MKLLLDTNVFNEKKLLSKLKQALTQVQLFINSIIYLELGYIYFIRDEWDLFLTVLRKLKINTETITQNIAKRAIKAATTFRHTKKGAPYYFRDCLIGATADVRKLILVTQNTKDFAWLQREYRITPTTLLAKLEKNSKSLRNDNQM